MGSTTVDLWIKGIGIAFGAASAVAAAFTYNRNARTKRAEFLMQLHNSFFVDADATYKRMKSLLDFGDAGGDEALAAAVREESPEFTDFLNLFELIAYFVEINILEGSDAEALLGYYFDLLRKKPPVWSYIAARRNGFEALRHLLQERTPM